MTQQRATAHGRAARAGLAAGLALALLAAGAGAAAAQDDAVERTGPETPATAEEGVAFPSSEGIVEGLLAEPLGDEDVPAVVVFHDAEGLDDHHRRMIQRLADAGFVALAVDLSSTAAPRVSGGFGDARKVENLELEVAMENARASVNWLETHLRSNGSVGAIGFGWGATIAGRTAAEETPLDALVSYYGGVFPPEALSQVVDVPMMFHFAGEGDTRQAAIDSFAARLEEMDKDFTIHVYEGVADGFDDAGAAGAHDPAAAQAAFDRTVEFLSGHLDAGPL